MKADNHDEPDENGAAGPAKTKKNLPQNNRKHRTVKTPVVEQTNFYVFSCLHLWRSEGEKPIGSSCKKGKTVLCVLTCLFWLLLSK